MEAAISRATDAEIFVHVRILLGVVVSLSIARLLSGLAEFVQHPGRKKPDVVHLPWVLAMLLTLVHFVDHAGLRPGELSVRPLFPVPRRSGAARPRSRASPLPAGWRAAA